MSYKIVTEIVDLIFFTKRIKAGINERNPSQIAYVQQFPIEFNNMNCVTMFVERLNYESSVCVIFSHAFLSLPLVV